MPRTRAGYSAEARAEAILAEHLTDKQWGEWVEKRTFRVTGDEGRLYRVDPYWNPHFPVTVLEAGRRNYHFGLERGSTLGVFHYDYQRHGYVALPIADVALALKLALEANEIWVLQLSCRGHRAV